MASLAFNPAVGRKNAGIALAFSLLTFTCLARPASATVVASATVTFTTTSCFVWDGSGTCSATASSTPGENPMFGSVSMSSGTVSAVNAGGFTVVQLLENGTASGYLDSSQALPVSWDVDVSDPTGATLSYEIHFNVTDGTELYYSTPTSTGFISQAGTTEISGNAVVNLPPGQITNFQEYIIVSAIGSETPPFSVTVPADSSLDINVAPTPEPASLILTGTGALLAGLQRLRRRKA